MAKNKVIPSFQIEANQRLLQPELAPICNKDNTSMGQEAFLKKLGKEGWELVSVSIYDPASTAFTQFHFYFKRPVG